MKNPNGNTLDKAVCEEIKKLTEDKSEFSAQLEKIKNNLFRQNESYEDELLGLTKSLNQLEKDIKTLVKSLCTALNETSQKYIIEEIEKLDAKKVQIEERIKNLNDFAEQQNFSEAGFENVKNMMLSFSKMFEQMSIEEKRNALKTFIRKIVWDGENVHIYLFGSDDANLNIIRQGDFEPQRKDSK